MSKAYVAYFPNVRPNDMSKEHQGSSWIYSFKFSSVDTYREFVSDRISLMFLDEISGSDSKEGWIEEFKVFREKWGDDGVFVDTRRVLEAYEDSPYELSSSLGPDRGLMADIKCFKERKCFPGPSKVVYLRKINKKKRSITTSEADDIDEENSDN